MAKGVRNEGAKFVEVFQKAGSLAEVAEKLGMTKNSVAARAVKLRQAGVPLKNMPRGGGKRVDYAALAALANSLAPEVTEKADEKAGS